jgi:F420-non-reducing hydrogenase iron-sulfur subunit
MHGLLEYVGVERDRLLVDWVSAAEGRHFCELATEFTGQVREMGPWGGK